MEKTQCLSGFIFLCNSTTKLECYQYRVFGLPSGKKEVVEEIKPGAKLFLFDFELKLLYGIYEATSAGTLNLEPAAFRGKFPAQVKFKIFKECLPLPESSLRHVIKENYTGSKFSQELSNTQVEKLLSSFRPLGTPSCQPVPQALANVSLPRAMPPPAMESRYMHRGRLPMMEVPDIAGIQYNHTLPLAESQTVPMGNYLQPVYHRTAAYMEHVHPTLGHPGLPATRNYHAASSQQPSFTERVAHGVQEPPYSRYRAIEGRAPHAQFTSLESRHMTLEQRAPHDEDTMLDRQYHHRFPLQEASYQDNMAASNSNPLATAHYTSSVMQTQVPAPYRSLPLYSAQYQDSIIAHSTANPVTHAMEQRAPHDVNTIPERLYHHQLPIQREAVYEGNVAPYNSNSSSAMVHGTSSVMQTQIPAYHHQSGTQYQDGIIAYSANPVAQAVEHRTQHNEPSILERQYHHQLPLQRGAVYQDNVAAYNSNPSSAMADHSSSVMQTQVPAYHQTGAQYQDGITAYHPDPAAQAMEPRAPHNEPSILQRQYHHQSSLQREAVYQGNVAAYSSNPSSAMVHHQQLSLQSGAQYQDSNVAYNTPNPASRTLTQPQLQLLAQYASSIMQPEVAAHAPITS